MRPGPVAVFPGSFDPLTVAHVAIADAAVAQLGLVRVDLVLSELAIDKDRGHTSIDARVTAIDALAGGGRAWLRALTTRDRLIADIASGYDVCVVGADKWHQLHDPRFYGDSLAARDAAVARLPLLAVAPREGCAAPRGAGFVLLDLAPEHRHVSSSAVRDGREEWRA